MNNSPSPKLASVWSVLIVAAGAMLMGCQTPKPGSSGGRIDPSRTTAAERASAKILPAALIEFSDQVAQRLSQQIADDGDIRPINQSGRRATIIVGDITNKTGIVSSNEFELIRSRIRNSLLRSKFVSDRLEFVENRARMESIRQREGVGAGDEQASGGRRLEPEMTFALNGDFYRISRGDVNQYYMEFQLVHFKTNKIVFSDRFDIKQQRN